MMSLIFLLILIAMLCALCGKKSFSYIVFTVVVLVSLFWLKHHSTDTLTILL
ncbi:DUF5993 family protein [Vibrio marisflavi]|uniref:DUF5993 family protein n=1 Tax=Vibrio marisflavi TaxID=1216040 RepID=UPI001F35ACFF|nr:DUF5993 family protein [Vibrio marisflavi]